MRTLLMALTLSVSPALASETPTCESSDTDVLFSVVEDSTTATDHGDGYQSVTTVLDGQFSFDVWDSGGAWLGGVDAVAGEAAVLSGGAERWSSRRCRSGCWGSYVKVDGFCFLSPARDGNTCGGSCPLRFWCDWDNGSGVPPVDGSCDPNDDPSLGVSPVLEMCAVGVDCEGP
jgi:hypothetical protein